MCLRLQKIPPLTWIKYRVYSIQWLADGIPMSNVERVHRFCDSFALNGPDYQERRNAPYPQLSHEVTYLKNWVF